MSRTKRASVALIVVLVLPIVAVHINAEVFKWRAERLLKRVKSFRVEQTPYSAIATLRKDYFSNVLEKEPCTEQQCEFSIGLAEWGPFVDLTWKHPWTERARYYAVLLLRHFGLRPTEFAVSLRIERRTLKSLGVELVPMSVIERPEYAPDGFVSEFFVTAQSAGNFRRLLYRSSIYTHPNLMVWKPTACTGCSGAITAEFTWQASREELDNALDFNLACLTRFRECKTVEEYLPSAAELLNRDVKQYAEWDSVPCDSRMAHILGRDSDFVDAVRLAKLGQPGDNFVVADYELLKPLKGQAPQLTSIYHSKELATANTAGRPSHPVLKVGAERVLFLTQMLGHASPESHCAVMAPTADVLNATLQGIADDRSGGSETR
jgi:hypothetical protein